MWSKFLNKAKAVAVKVKEIAELAIDIIDAVFNIKDAFARILTRKNQLA